MVVDVGESTMHYLVQRQDGEAAWSVVKSGTHVDMMVELEARCLSCYWDDCTLRIVQAPKGYTQDDVLAGLNDPGGMMKTTGIVYSGLASHPLKI